MIIINALRYNTQTVSDGRNDIAVYMNIKYKVVGGRDSK